LVPCSDTVICLIGKEGTKARCVSRVRARAWSEIPNQKKRPSSTKESKTLIQQKAAWKNAPKGKDREKKKRRPCLGPREDRPSSKGGARLEKKKGGLVQSGRRKKGPGKAVLPSRKKEGGSFREGRRLAFLLRLGTEREKYYPHGGKKVRKKGKGKVDSLCWKGKKALRQTAISFLNEKRKKSAFLDYRKKGAWKREVFLGGEGGFEKGT